MAVRFEYAESDFDEDGQASVEIAVVTDDPALIRKARKAYERLLRDEEPSLVSVKRKDKADDD